MIDSSISKNYFCSSVVRKYSAYIFTTKSAIKERRHSKYHHQMAFHITVSSNILTDITRMPLGTLGIKFRDSKMFIRRNRLNRLMGYKLN